MGAVICGKDDGGLDQEEGGAVSFQAWNPGRGATGGFGGRFG